MKTIIHSPQDQFLSTFIVLQLRILFWCALKSNSVKSLYLQLECLETLRILLQASFVEIRLMARALLIYLIPSHEEDSEYNLRLLQEDELSALVQWLNIDIPGPFSYPITYIRAFLPLLECFCKVPENVIVLLQSDIPVLLGDLINDDILSNTVDQEYVASVLWTLMNFDESGENEPMSKKKSDDNDCTGKQQCVFLHEWILIHIMEMYFICSC